MDPKIEKLTQLQEDIAARRINRRDVLKRATMLGLSVPAIAALLAACGSDDDDETATESSGDEGTATEGSAAGETETAEEEEVEPTEAEEEATEVEEGATEEIRPTNTATEAPAETGYVESPDGMMGKEISEGTAGGVLIEGSFSDISTVNPVLSSDSASNDFLSFVFEPMIEPNPDNLEPTGTLATAWRNSEDGLTWSLKLREDVTWHDGTPFTAEDVKFTYESHMNEETGSSYTSDFNDKIESIEVVDDYTIDFNLKIVVVDFLVDLGVYAIIPKHIWEDVPPADFAANPGSTGEDPSLVVGTGPFVFEQWTLEDNASVLRYDDYWGGAAYLDKIVYKIVADQTAGVQQLKTGEIDFFEGVPEALVADLDGTDVAVIDYPTVNFTMYGTNMDPEKTELFVDANVRQALMYALDREAMIESIRFGYGLAAVGTMPVLSWAYNPDGIEMTYPYDVDMANQLMDEAGWTLGDDGIREKDGVKMSFNAYTNSGNTVREQYLVIMQEYWSAIGVEMTPQLEPFPALVERITETYDFEVVLIGFSWSATPDQSTMWKCDSYGGGFNFVKYCNPEVDTLLDEALSEPDQDTRVQIYTDFQNVLLPDIPIAVMDFPQGISGVNNRVQNLYPSSVNARFNTETWWIES